MKKTNKFAALGVASVAAITLVAAPGIVSAHQGEGNEEFVSELSAKLGVDSSDLQSAMDEVRDENKAEKQAEMQTKIDEAVASGDLTERQAEIINALQGIREDLKPAEGERLSREEMQALSDDERTALMEEKKTEMQQATIDALADAGLEVSADELQELRTATQDLGIGGPQGRGGHGPRGGMMR